MCHCSNDRKIENTLVSCCQKSAVVDLPVKKEFGDSYFFQAVQQYVRLSKRFSFAFGNSYGKNTGGAEAHPTNHPDAPLAFIDYFGIVP